ncbi:MAG TPA: AAA family ATPase, partial [Flavobacterium sp.]|nr:AAA family ATPase [Flavobacterium sp.]
MKIIAIRIKNLASLDGTTEINFTQEPLCSAGIFAITGATGAGKSTILDALCLALYGKTPRYLQAKEVGIEIHDVSGTTISQGDVRGILRDGTAEGYAEVDFAGIDGLPYRATWSVRRARNRAEGSIQDYSICLKNISTNIDIPGKKAEVYKEIERLVGLNFEQFTRSVLLAQGDFTAFLKANKDEKASLLEKLTGTRIYSEISKKIYDQWRLEEQLLRDLNVRMEGITSLSADELKDLRDQHEASNVRITMLEEKIGKLAADVHWYHQLGTLQANRDAANVALANAFEAKTSATAREQLLQHAEKVQITRSWHDALHLTQHQKKQKEIELSSVEETIEILRQQNEDINKSFAESEQNLAVKNKAAGDAAPLLEQAKQLDIVIAEKQLQLVKANEDAKAASIKSEEHQTDLQWRQQEADKLKLDIERAEQWIAAHGEKQHIAANHDIIISKLTDAQLLVEAIHNADEQLENAKIKIRADEHQKSLLDEKLLVQQHQYESLKKSCDKASAELLLIPI